MNIAFFVSSLLSSYWNGAATYYRGIGKALHERGHRVTFYEPDAYDRQKYRDIDPPPWAEVVVYSGNNEAVCYQLEAARGADLIIKASGVGVFDEMLEAGVVDLKTPSNLVAFWDVDAPATLERVQDCPGDAFRPLIPEFDLIFTYGGGRPVIEAYEALGAKACVPVYNGLDPEVHFPVAAEPRFEAALGFLANRLPDREARVDEFFFRAAAELPARSFLLGGNGWADKEMPENVSYLGHVGTEDHNAFNSSPLAVLNVNRESMARFGYSPATRVFEAAGAAACMISDPFAGVEEFFEPGAEILIAASGEGVAAEMEALAPDRARRIGEAARKRALAQHTYRSRIETVENALAIRSRFEGAASHPIGSRS